jgi:Eukaryotic translation initiation factor 2 alpha subunit
MIAQPLQRGSDPGPSNSIKPFYTHWEGWVCRGGFAPKVNITQLTSSQSQVNNGEPIECLTDDVKDAIMKNIRRRMTPQPVKIRADVELTCFSYDGILHIQVYADNTLSLVAC